MGNDSRLVKDQHQKNIVKLFSRFDGSKNRRKVFEDFVTASAIAISNSCDETHAEEREEHYLQIVKQYKPAELETFGEMLAEIVMGMEDNPNQDFLGEMYMALEFGSSSAGQFFTPYSVCRCMAEMLSDWELLNSRISENGFISVSDPACGAGALLVAFANACRSCGLNYQQTVLFVAQDLDYTVGMMCYIALSLLGCAGYVVIGDTLIDPCTSYDSKGLLPRDNGRVWYTPMFCSPIWQGRRLAAQLDLLLSGNRKPTSTERKPVETQKMALQRAETKAKPITPVVISPEPETQFNVMETGQLSFF